MSDAPAAPRFPHIGTDAPHYESYFIKARDPEKPRAFWMRHTVHQRPGQPRTASIWLTLFEDGAAHPVVAGKHTVGGDELAAPPGGYIRIGDSVVEPGGARGSLSCPTLTTDWEFTVASDEPELRHLPIDRMYEARVPRTKSVTPHPGAVFSGSLGDWSLDGWVGVSSHNWGTEHAERWIYLQCGQFEGHGRDTWLEMTIGRIKLGPVTVPWIANGALSLDGTRHRLGGPQRAPRTKVRETPTSLALTVADLSLELEAPKEHFVAWRYADPEGPEHHTAHTSIADVRVRAKGADLVARQAATYELGMRESDHGLPLQPFDDGRL